MATTSTLSQVKDAILAGLVAALPTVQVTRSFPGTQVERPESIYLGDARATSLVPVSRAGRAKRQESYDLDVFIVALGSGATSEAAEDRAFVLLGELEDVLADDMTLGDLPIISATLAEWEETTLFDDTRRGYIVQLRAVVHVEARLA